MSNKFDSISIFGWLLAVVRDNRMERQALDQDYDEIKIPKRQVNEMNDMARGTSLNAWSDIKNRKQERRGEKDGQRTRLNLHSYFLVLHYTL